MFLKSFYEDDIQSDIQVAPRGKHVTLMCILLLATKTSTSSSCLAGVVYVKGKDQCGCQHPGNIMRCKKEDPCTECLCGDIHGAYIVCIHSFKGTLSYFFQNLVLCFI